MRTVRTVRTVKTVKTVKTTHDVPTSFPCGASSRYVGLLLLRCYQYSYDTIVTLISRYARPIARLHVYTFIVSERTSENYIATFIDA